MRDSQQCESIDVPPCGACIVDEVPVGHRVLAIRWLIAIAVWGVFGLLTSRARAEKVVEEDQPAPIAIQKVQIQRGLIEAALEVKVLGEAELRDETIEPKTNKPATRTRRSSPRNGAGATDADTGNGDATESKPGDPTKPVDPQVTAKLLDGLEVIEKEVARLQGLPAPGRRTKGVVLFVDSTHCGVANYYSNTPTRYLVTRLQVVNLEAAEIEIRPLEIELLTGGERLSGKERNGTVENEGVQVDGSHQQVRNLKSEASVKVPAGGSASAWVVISGLPNGAFVPEMTLEIPVGDAKQSFDLTTFERGRLAMTVERIGPKGALAVLTIGGELNTVNVGRLTGELESLGGIGVSRAVIAGTDTMPSLQNNLQNWIVQARQNNPNNRQFSHLPTLSSALRELHIAKIKGIPSEIPGISVHETPLEAVSAALRTAYEVLPPEQILTAIRTGDVRTRAAALEHGSRQLTQDAVPYLLKLTQEKESDIRRAAVASLVNFGTQDVVDRLMRVAVDDPEPYSTTALHSLAGSRFPASHDALTALIGQDSKVSQSRLIGVLGEHPRPQWADTVYELTKSSDVELRKTATQTLIRIGHERLFDVLESALSSENSALQNIAYNHLATQVERRSEELAMNHAVQVLSKGGPLDSTTQQLIQRTRDQRVVPLLLKQLDDEKSSKSTIIQVLMYIGDQTVAQELVTRFSKLNEQDRSSVLGQMQNLQPDLAVKLARQSMDSKNNSLLHQSCNILAMHDACDETVELLKNALKRHSKNDTGVQNAICNALGMIGSASAKAVLVEARDGENKTLTTYAKQGLQNMRNMQPGGNYVSMANYYLDQAKDLKNAETHLKYAFKIDPDMPDAFDARARLRLRQRKYADAVTDATRAIQLEPTIPTAYSTLGQAYFQQDKYKESIPHLQKAVEMDLHDPMMLTSLGIALAMTGQGADGVKVALKWKDEFSGDSTYNYNIACVYARAAEQQKPVEPNPKNPDGKDPKVAEWRTAALSSLKKSITQGFVDFKHIQNDPDLKSLHDIPEFRKLSKLDEPLPKEGDAPGATPDEADAPQNEAPINQKQQQQKIQDILKIREIQNILQLQQKLQLR